MLPQLHWLLAARKKKLLHQLLRLWQHLLLPPRQLQHLLQKPLLAPLLHPLPLLPLLLPLLALPCRLLLLLIPLKMLQAPLQVLLLMPPRRLPTLLLPRSKFSELLKKPPLGGFFYALLQYKTVDRLLMRHSNLLLNPLLDHDPVGALASGRYYHILWAARKYVSQNTLNQR